MAQLYSFASLRVPAGVARGLRLNTVDPEIHNVGRIDADETPIGVEFVGLTEEQQRAALAAFPGGKRFYLLSTKRAQGDA